jgi:AcrR family transcriptional regulator
MPVTKERIADVFEKHVARFGFQKTTLDEVAAELHISKKTLYVHFESKADIWRYVVSRVASDNQRELAAAVAPLPTFGERIEALTRLVLRQARAHILETTETDWRQEYEVAAEAFTAAVGSLMRELVSGGLGDGEFAFGDPAVAERLISAMVLEYVLMVREEPALDRDEEFVAGIRRFLG